MVKVAFRSRAFADPGRGNAVVAFVGGGHRPTDGLRELRAEVSGDGEEPILLARVHDRELAAFERIRRVRIDLVHHRQQRIAAGDENSLLAIGREAHVRRFEGERRGNRHRLFAHALYVEAGLALALRAVHAIVVGANEHHRPQAFAQSLGRDTWIPGAERLAVEVEDADERVGEVGDVVGAGRNFGTRDRAGLGKGDSAEVRCVPGRLLGSGI